MSCVNRSGVDLSRRFASSFSDELRHGIDSGRYQLGQRELQS